MPLEDYLKDALKDKEPVEIPPPPQEPPEPTIDATGISIGVLITIALATYFFTSGAASYILPVAGLGFALVAWIRSVRFYTTPHVEPFRIIIAAICTAIAFFAHFVVYPNGGMPMLFPIAFSSLAAVFCLLLVYED